MEEKQKISIKDEYERYKTRAVRQLSFAYDNQTFDNLVKMLSHLCGSEERKNFSKLIYQLVHEKYISS